MVVVPDQGEWSLMLLVTPPTKSVYSMLYFIQMLPQDKNQNVSNNYNDHDWFQRSFTVYSRTSYGSRQLCLILHPADSLCHFRNDILARQWNIAFKELNTLGGAIDGRLPLPSPLPLQTTCKNPMFTQLSSCTFLLSRLPFVYLSDQWWFCLNTLLSLNTIHLVQLYHGCFHVPHLGQNRLNRGVSVTP